MTTNAQPGVGAVNGITLLWIRHHLGRKPRGVAERERRIQCASDELDRLEGDEAREARRRLAIEWAFERVCEAGTVEDAVKDRAAYLGLNGDVVYYLAAAMQVDGGEDRAVRMMARAGLSLLADYDVWSKGS